MAEEIGALRVMIEAGIASFEKNMGKVRAEVKKSAAEVTRSTKTMEAGFSKASGMVRRFVGAYLLYRSIGIAKKSLDETDAIAKLGQRIGMTAEETQRWGHAANLANVESGQLLAAFTRLRVAMGEAKNGSSEQTRAFQSLGISIVDVNGKMRTAEDIMLEIADAFQDMGDSADFSSAASKILGRSWSNLAPILKDGSDGIVKAKKDLDDISGVLSNETVAGAERASDALTRLWTAIRVGATKAWAVAGPIIEDLANLATRIVGGGERTADQITAEIERLRVGYMRLAELRDRAAKGEGLNAIFGGGEGQVRMLQSQMDSIIARTIQLQAELEKTKRKWIDITAGGGNRNTRTQLAFALKTADEGFEKMSQLKAEAGAALADLATPAERLSDAMATYNSWLEIGIVNQDEFNRLVGKAQSEYMGLDKAAEEVFSTIGSGFEDAIMEGKKFSEVLAELAKDMTRIFLRATVTKPLAEAFSSGASSLFAGLFGGGSTYLSGLQGMASGGPISGPALVGERGPELFMPSRPGTIIPNDKIGQAMGGTSNRFIVDMRGASMEAVARLESLVLRVNGSIEQRAIGAVMDAKRRGGTFAHEIGG